MIEAKFIGWQPLGDCAYLHAGKPDEEEMLIDWHPRGQHGGDECVAAVLTPR